MAWEWVSPVVGGVVSVVSVTAAVWSTTSIRRGQQKADKDKFSRERLEELYINMLASGQALLVSSKPKTTIIGEPPTPLSTNEVLLRSARLRAFADPKIVATNELFVRECGQAVTWWQLAGDRVRELMASESVRHVFMFPDEAEGMDHAQLANRAEEHWFRAESLYHQLVEQVRGELSY